MACWDSPTPVVKKYGDDGAGGRRRRPRGQPGRGAPKGFPPLTIPHVRLADLGPLSAGALGIALVSLADTISTASAFAARSGQEVRGNQEMTGIGAECWKNWTRR